MDSKLKKQQILANKITSSDWWDNISKHERNSYKRGIKDWQEGRIHSHDDVKQLYKKYLLV